MEEKKRVRQTMKKKMETLSEETYRSMCMDIAAKLTALPEWEKAGIIGVTLSTTEEIDTEPIIRRAWAEGKKTAAPKADPKEKTMDFRVIRSFGEVEEAFAGIREPIPERTESVSPEEIDLLIVPGLVFDEEGYRIGFGGGFYDRFLQKYKGPTVSLAFEMQVTEHVPAESFDRPVGIIVTDQRVIRTGKR